ncbi:ImuA family protein [Brevundimonas sp.]|jgi:protein ImuA|uniref:ImuA family protein n=1 Tax=Brevundimonas sp. TaxID=1871086 RepID=UPI003783736F
MQNIKCNIARIRNLTNGLSCLNTSACPEIFSTGMAELDTHLGGGLRTKAVHEIFAADTAQSQAADGFALGLALRAKPKSMVWVMQTRAFPEAGVPYGPGVEDWGLETRSLVLVMVRDTAHLLSASEEALASGAVDAVLMSAWGEGPAFTLTASRRLALAATRGGSTGFFVRAAARPASSAAETRWRVRAAPSMPLEAQAPGLSALAVELLRSKSGSPCGEWIVEWDRETRTFIAPSTPRSLVSVSADRAQETGQGNRRAA